MTTALVVYESIYGNTRALAEAIAEGLGPDVNATARPVHQVGEVELEAADLLVVGGPTHMHGLASSMSRKLAIKGGEDEGAHIEPGAREEPGLRAWLATLEGEGTSAAAYDTRLDRSPTMTGVAARGIARRLRHRRCTVIADPESFLVQDAEGPLVEGEIERAAAWGKSLARELSGE